MNLTPEQEQSLKSHLKAIAEILYSQTPKDNLKTFEGIEKSLQQHLLAYVGPEIAKFFFQKQQEFKLEGPDKLRR